MIQLNNVFFGYIEDKWIINNFNYTFLDHGLYLVEGESGSGKTTLLNLIGGLLKPNSGAILYDYDIFESDISYIFQDNNLLEELSLLENVKLILKINHLDLKIDELNFYLEKFEMKEDLETLVKNLSGGQRQRLSIIIGLLRKTKIMLIDEPFSSLDQENSIKIINVLKDLSKDILIIITSHKKNLIEVYCDFIINLKEAKCDENKNKMNGINELKKNKIICNPQIIFSLHHNAFKFNIFQFLFTIIILSLNIAMIILSISIETYDLNKYLCQYLIENNQTSMIFINDNSLEPLETDLTQFSVNYLYHINIDTKEINGYLENEYRNEYFDEPIILKYVSIDDSLADNEIILSDYMIDYLQYVNIIPYNNYFDIIGSEIEIYNNKLIIRDIFFTEYKKEDMFYLIEKYTLMYMNKNTYFNFNSYGQLAGFEIKDASVDEIVELASLAINNNYRLDFQNYYKVKEKIDNMNTIRIVMKFVVIIFSVLSSLWIFYIDLVKIKGTKRFFSSLNLYGLNKGTIAIVLLLDSIYNCVISFIFGTYLGYLLCNLVSSIFQNIGNITINIYIFDLISVIYSLLFIFIITCIFSLVSFYVFIRNKKESHISE